MLGQIAHLRSDLQVCVRNLAALPLFARDLVDFLVADAFCASAAAPG